jgi:tetratricopeptide (TPR) repeat protein
MDQGEFTKRNLGARRTEAERSYVKQLVAQGDQLESQGQLQGARARFQEAESLQQGAGRPGLDRIQHRQNEYNRLKGLAENDARAGRMDAARDKATEAQKFDPEQFRVDNLLSRLEGLKPSGPPANKDAERARDLINRAQGQIAQRNYSEAEALYRQAATLDPQNADAAAWLENSREFASLRDRGRQLFRENKLQEARQAFNEARQRDEQRFGAEGLESLLKQIEDVLGKAPAMDLTPVRTALVAYLQGDVNRAASLLEPLAGNASLDAGVRAHVFAFLGAAYADQSLSVRSDGERSALRQKALDQFRRLIDLQPGYRLSEGLVSPRVREILDEARTRR